MVNLRYSVPYDDRAVCKSVTTSNDSKHACRLPIVLVAYLCFSSI